MKKMECSAVAASRIADRRMKAPKKKKMTEAMRILVAVADFTQSL